MHQAGTHRHRLDGRRKVEDSCDGCRDILANTVPDHSGRFDPPAEPALSQGVLHRKKGRLGQGGLETRFLAWWRQTFNPGTTVLKVNGRSYTAPEFDEMKIRRNPDCPVCGEHPTITEYVDYVEFCAGVQHA